MDKSEGEELRRQLADAKTIAMTRADDVIRLQSEVRGGGEEGRKGGGEERRKG